MEENKIPQGSNNVEDAISWVEKLGGLIKKLGLQNIILSIMVLFLVIVVGHVAFNPESFVEKVENIKTKKHTEAVLKRLSSYNDINNTLVEIQDVTGADRVLVYETHNGGSNLANLPFLYVDLTYGVPKTEFITLEEEYKNVRLSRYPWASYLYENTVFNGTIDDMEPIDPELYYRLKKEDVDYFYSILMYGKDALPCGFLSLVYKDREKALGKEQLAKLMHKYSNIVSALLMPVDDEK